jgi:hypothetical protein
MKKFMVSAVGLLAFAFGPAARAENWPAAVFQPTFITSQEQIKAGKIFAAKVEGCPQNVLVTAYHLFGPLGGFATQLTPAQIATTVRSIELSSIKTGAPLHTLWAKSLTPPGADACCTENSVKPLTGVGDVAAFRGLPSLASVALPLAAEPAKIGDKVTVVTSLKAPFSSGIFRFEAVVFAMDNGYLRYRYLKPGYIIKATSGAPVVNEDGRVVAINLGGGVEAKSHAIFGFGNPVGAWRDALAQLCN